MMNAPIKDSLIAQLDNFPYDLQLRIVDFARTLPPTGVKGKSLLRFEGGRVSYDTHFDAIENLKVEKWQ